MSDKYSKEWILRSAQKENVSHIHLQFTDLHGTIRNVKIPRNQLEEALDNKIVFDGSSIKTFTGTEESDLYLYPDLSTWVVYPSDSVHGEKAAGLICDVYNPDGTPFLVQKCDTFIPGFIPEEGEGEQKPMIDQHSKETILKAAQEENVSYIRLQFTDLLGTIKNVEIPRNQLEKALDNKIMFDGSSIEGFVRIEESDMYLYPDPSTWVVYPWDSVDGGKIAGLICDVYNPDGTPFSGDPRGILKRALNEAKKLGFSSFNIGPEPEFFLFKTNESGDPVLDLNDQGGYFDLAPLDLGENCRRDIVLTLDQMGFEVEASHHEVAPGQHEIDFKYADALKAADQIQIFKLVVKNVARRYNLHATFMPKPLFGMNGSGMHCHQSLFKEDTNAFYDSNHELGLSETARHYLAGILKHARAFTAITNPLVNSYKRLVPGYEAPCYVAWSPKNRSPLVRVPASRGVSTRIELRSPDPSANPYLALAVMLRSGLDGIKNKLPLAEQTDRNIYVMSEEERKKEGIDSLPANLQEALVELQKDPVMRETLGDHAMRHFVEAKRIEWDNFRTQVHDWERKQYLTLY